MVKRKKAERASKKVERTPKDTAKPAGIQGILSSEKVDFLIGLLLVVLAIYSIIAMSSFLVTGRADQSILEDLRAGEWLNTDHDFRNYCGSSGAIMSYALMTLCFGIPAYIIPLFVAIVGLKMMRVYTINAWKWFFCLAFTMIWCSVAFAKFITPLTPNMIFNPGGNHGLYAVQQIEAIVGEPGLIAILVFTAIAFLTYLSSETVIAIRKALNPVKYLTGKIKVTVTNTDEGSSAFDYRQQGVAEEQQPVSEEESAEESEEEGSNTIEIVGDPTVHESPNKPESGAEDTELTVQVGAETQKAQGKSLAKDERLDTPINPKEPFTKYKYPTLDLLKKYDSDGKPFIDMDEIKANNEQIVKVLKSFGIDIKEIKATVGPTITLYEITPAEGVRIAKIKNLEDDIALSLSALGVRIIAPMPGKGTIGIEVPNKKPNIVSMESILNSKKFQDTKMDLPIALGKTITNDVYMADLAKIPHLLVAGATGQGKSVGLNAILTSLLYKKHPNELKLVLIDPKQVEFSIYAPIAQHFMAALPENEEEPIITDVTKVVRTLNSLCVLMDDRYSLLKAARVRNIKEYNEKYVNHLLNPEHGHDYMPYIVVVIDEFGDLIMTAGKEIELPIARIAQKARAVGIHMVIATQRPTTNIITGTIKANFPGRIAYKVSSMIDSRTILDRVGANKLVGKGDMLVLTGSDPVRVQCAFVDTPEVERVNEYIAGQPGPLDPLDLPEPIEDTGAGGVAKDDLGSLDPFFEEAARSIVTTQQGSTSMIQRRFSIGYNRAGRLMDQLEKAGIVGPAHGSKPREVLISDESQLNKVLSQLSKND